MTDRIIEGIMGPYRGNRLIVSDANADAAIADHWARDPYAADDPHDPLTEAERAAALDAAHTWAQALWDAAAAGDPPPEPAPPAGTMTARQMKPQERGNYQTRSR
jgi:hypothetical protein